MILVFQIREELKAIACCTPSLTTTAHCAHIHESCGQAALVDQEGLLALFELGHKAEELGFASLQIDRLGFELGF